MSRCCLSGKLNPSATTSVAKDSVANPDHAVTMQLFKTKMCSFFEAGRCGLANCKFAHGACELKDMPDLKKTKLCCNFLRGRCSTDGSCSFAHFIEDLRFTDGVYKTHICRFFRNGGCKKGDRCKHAHGERDLRRTSSGTSLHTPSVESRSQHLLPLTDLLAEKRPAAMSPFVKSMPTMCFSPMTTSPVLAGVLPVQGYLVGTAPETFSCSAAADSQAPPRVYPLSPISAQRWVPVIFQVQKQPQMMVPLHSKSQSQLNFPNWYGVEVPTCRLQFLGVACAMGGAPDLTAADEWNPSGRRRGSDFVVPKMQSFAANEQGEKNVIAEERGRVAEYRKFVPNANNKAKGQGKSKDQKVDRA